MRKIAQSITSITVLSLFSLGFVGNLFSVKAQSKGKSPTPPPKGAGGYSENKRLIAEAEKYFKDLLSRYVTKCDDGTYYMMVIGKIYQMENYSISVEVSSPEFLSRVDKLNGHELHGRAMLKPRGWYREFPGSYRRSMNAIQDIPEWSKYIEIRDTALMTVWFEKNNGKYGYPRLTGYIIPTCKLIESFTTQAIPPDTYHLIIQPDTRQRINRAFVQCGNRYYHAFDSKTLLEIEDVKTEINPPEWYYKAPGLDRWEGSITFYGNRYKLWTAPGALADSGTFNGKKFLSFTLEYGPAPNNELSLGADYSIMQGPWRWSFPNTRTQREYNLAQGIAPSCELAERFIKGENVSLPHQ